MVEMPYKQIFVRTCNQYTTPFGAPKGVAF